MLKFKVKEMLEVAGVDHLNKYLIKSCGFSRSKAFKIIHNKQDSISLSDFSKLCENLGCTPNDFMYWEETPSSKLPADHPCMTQLTQPDKITKWSAVFKHLTKEKITAIQKRIKEEFGLE